MGWNYLRIPKLQRSQRWNLWMEKQCHPTFYLACAYISVLGMNLNRVGKRGPRHAQRCVYPRWYDTCVLDTSVISLWFGVFSQLDHLPIVARTIYGNWYRVKWQIYSTFLKAPDLRCETITAAVNIYRPWVRMITHCENIISFLSHISLLGLIISIFWFQVSSKKKLQWCHNGHPGVSNNLRLRCLSIRVFRFPSPKASYTEIVSIRLRHHVTGMCCFICCWDDMMRVSVLITLLLLLFNCMNWIANRGIYEQCCTTTRSMCQEQRYINYII